MTKICRCYLPKCITIDLWLLSAYRIGGLCKPSVGQSLLAVTLHLAVNGSECLLARQAIY